MATIHVFRHAEAMHNIDERYRNTRDPLLTPAGMEQCRIFSEQFPFMDKIACVLSSPLKRAIQSSLLAFAPALRNKQVIVLPEITEVGSHPSGFGSSPEELVSQFGNRINVDNVPHDFADLHPESPWAYEMEKIIHRMGLARDSLKDLAIKAGDGAHIVVMTHGQSCHFLAEDFDGPKPPIFRCEWDGNLTYRSYKVDLSTSRWIEVPESREKRGAPVDSHVNEAAELHIVNFLVDKIEGRREAMQKLYSRYRVAALEGKYTVALT